METGFDFGKNWENFSGHLNYRDYANARESLEKLVPDLKDKTFLDVGCGCGLFSIAASSLGAREVLGFDINPKCISVSKKLLNKISNEDPKVRKDAVKFEAESILDENFKPREYDIVYSWGVLHHTGNMHKAFDSIKNLVKENGLLVIAIYNKHFTSPIWKAIKYIYNKSPAFIKLILVYSFLIVNFFGLIILFRRNPLKKDRGMSFYFDVVDWIGGYPYEYASITEVKDYFESRGFTLKKAVRGQGFTGCNQFIFEKAAKCAE